MTTLLLTVAVSRSGSDGWANSWYVSRTIQDPQHVPRLGDLVQVGHRTAVGTDQLSPEFAQVKQVQWDGDLTMVSVSLSDLEFSPGSGLHFEEGWLADPDDTLPPSYY